MLFRSRLRVYQTISASRRPTDYRINALLAVKLAVFRYGVPRLTKNTNRQVHQRSGPLQYALCLALQCNEAIPINLVTALLDP
jgi:hypothetical protein